MENEQQKDEAREAARELAVKTLFDAHLLFVGEIPAFEQGFDSGYEHGLERQQSALRTVAEELRAMLHGDVICHWATDTRRKALETYIQHLEQQGGGDE